jgi:hypothetical protein
MKFYRMMRAADDGLPQVGDTFARLGVRPNRPGQKYDVPAAGPTDPVRPGDGGLSVFAGPPDDLPAHLKPPAARFPLWEIDDADLGPGLAAVQAGPPHYHVEARHTMTLAEFQAALAATRGCWVRIQWGVP